MLIAPSKVAGNFSPSSVPMLHPEKLYISSALLQELKSYGDTSPQKEVCGLISGAHDVYWRAETFHPITNVSSGDTTYDDYVMDPDESMNILKDTNIMPIGENKFDLVATFHTHPRSTPYPSIVDIQYAAYNVTYIIYSVVLDKFSFNFWNGSWFIPIDVKVI